MSFMAPPASTRSVGQLSVSCGTRRDGARPDASRSGFRVARHGQLLFERCDGLFTDFLLQAALHWCDIEPVVRRAHAAVLAEPG